MPRDLFAEQNITPTGPTASAGGPRDLLAGQVNPPQPLWGRLASDIDIGGAQMGAGVRSAPHYIAQMLAAHGAISPQTAARFPKPDVLTPQQRGQFWGVPKPNIGDVLLQGAAQYAPYGLAGGASLAGQTAAGGAFGATQTPRPLAGAGIGAATNLLLGIGAPLAARRILPLTRALSKYAAPGLKTGVKNILDKLKTFNNSDSFNKAANNFEQIEGREKNAWDNVSNQALNIDVNQPGINFDDSNYIQALQKRLGERQTQTSQSELASKNADTIDRLGRYIDDPHSSFTDAILHNQSLNSAYRDNLTPLPSNSLADIKFAQQNLKKTIQQNLKNNNLQATLGNSWENANQITANKNRLFGETITPKGKTVTSSFLNYYKGEKGDPSQFVQEYLPKAKGEGIQNMQKFSEMIGDADQAKNVLKHEYFSKTYNEDSIKPQAFLAKYNDLSKEQQDYLFNPQENNIIKAFRKVLANNPTALQKPSFRSFVWHNSAPALIGAGIGLPFHHPYEGALAGVVGTRLAELGLQQWGKRAAPQARVISALTGGELPTKTPGMLGKLLASRFGAAAATPQTTKLAGGQ